MAKLRAAIITDIHYGFDVRDKLGSKAPRLMDHFVRTANRFAADVVIDIGDRVSAKDHETDKANMIRCRAHFNAAAAPLESVLGNHDIKNLTREENAQIMGTPGVSYSRDVGGFHLVFWNPKTIIDDNGFGLNAEDMDWLKNDLAAAHDKKAIVFTHVPLDNLDGEELAPVSKYYFWTQGADVRKILEDAGNVVLCLHGHRHRNRHREISGIHYITQQSLTSTWREHYRVPSGTYSLLEANDEKITLRLMGKFRTIYEIPLRPPAAATPELAP